MKRFLFILVTIILLANAALNVLAEENGARLFNSEGFVYQIKDDGTAVIVGYTGKNKEPEIPETLDSIPVTEIGDKAFFGNETIKTIIVPGCIKKIGSLAFEWCPGLTSVRLLEGVEVLSNYTFRYCKKLNRLTFPMSIIQAGYGIVSECTNLKNLDIPADHPYFELVDDVLFTRGDHRLIWYSEQKKDKEYIVPEGTEIIDTFAFSSSKMVSVVIPETVREIHDFSFHRCEKLRKLNIPDSVTSINGIFVECDSVEEIKIPEDHPTLRSLDDVIFTREPQELVYYPRTKKSRSYSVPEGTVKIINNAFEDCKLISVEIPGSVKTIEHNAFFQSKQLRNIVLHEGTESFTGEPFQRCSALTEITLPSTLINVEQNPFLGCFKMKKVKIEEGNPSLVIRNGSLIDQSTDTLLWYPVSSKEKSYTVPEEVKVIAPSAFAGADLSELILNEGVTVMPLLQSCKKIKRVVLPSSLKTIEIHKSIDTDISRISFVVVPGSYAENYCQVHNLKYEYAE